MQFPSRKVSSADCQLNWEALLKLLPQSGDLKMGAYATPDDGWLLCDGSSYDPQKYPDLYSKIGTTYGGTSSAPLLPDFRGRAPVGSGTGDATGATAHSLGAKVGKETHVLQTSEMPSHSHGFGTRQPFKQSNSGAYGYNATPDGNNSNAIFADGSPQTITNTGGGGAHENRTPSSVINFFVKT